MHQRSKFVAALLLTGAFAACATSPHHHPGSVPPPPTAPKVIYLQHGDRNPAQAPDLRWVPAVVPVQVDSAQRGYSTRVTVNQEMSWTERVAFEDTRFEYREVEADYTCYEYVCRGGSGKSELWDAYFAAPRNRKAKALADAIQGIGAVSAEALVTKDYFRSKPRSWQEFTHEINRAARNGVIKKSVATQVIHTHRAANLAQLGYAAGSCSERAMMCTAWVERLVPVSFTNYRNEVRKRVVASRDYEVAVSISNSKLLSTEQEQVQIEIDENGRLVSSEASGALNRYALSATQQGGRVAVSMTGVQRYLREVNANAVRQDSFVLFNGTPVFTIDVDPSVLPTSEDSNSQLVLDYAVMTCETNWIGTCKLTRDYMTLRKESKPLTQSRTSFSVDVPGRSLKAWIEYSVSRRNSAFFSDRATPKRKTDTVKK